MTALTKAIEKENVGIVRILLSNDNLDIRIPAILI